MLLKLKKFDRFQHPVFSTHSVHDAEKTEKKLRKLAVKLSVGTHNPIWVSEKHGTCLVTMRNKDLSHLIVDALYEMKLSARIVEHDDKKFPNVWANDVRLHSRPDLGELVEFDDSDSDDDE